MQYVVRVTKSLKSSVFLNLCLLLEAAMNESFGNVAADTNLPKAERAAGERLKWRASQILLLSLAQSIGRPTSLR